MLKKTIKNTMQRVKLSTLVALTASFPNISHAQDEMETITVRSHKIDHLALQEYFSDFDPFAFGPVKKDGLDRHLAEQVIFTMAPIIGECNCKINIEPYKASTSFARSIQTVSSGANPSFPIAIFDTKDSLALKDTLLSDPITKEDEFFVGLYTHEDRSDILSLSDLSEIRELEFVVAENWFADIEVLEKRNFNTNVVGGWASILRSIESSRGDVIMQPFSGTEDMSFTDEITGKRFLPIPGIKLAFSHARRYMVSETHPQGGQKFVDTINAGLKVLREKGVIEDYMTKAGVFDPRIAEFEEL